MQCVNTHLCARTGNGSSSRRVLVEFSEERNHRVQRLKLLRVNISFEHHWVLDHSMVSKTVPGSS